MAVTHFNPTCSKPRLHSSQLSFLSRTLPRHRHCSFAPLHRTQHARISCSVAPNEVQVPAVTTLDPKSKADCYGVFCLTYDLRAEEETRSWKKLINIAVSGAAGMIANHLLFKLASGEVFGPDQPIALKLLGSERSIQALEGVAMELEDSLFPLLREVSIGIDPYEVFQDAEWALLIGAKPRGPGMERADLLDINGQIYAAQGRALNAVASRNVKVIVVGNPCNTNALICLKNAPNIPAKNFHALTRLDENRAKCQLALKAGVFYDKVSNVTIWGNHSTTQVPDFLNAKIDGLPVKEVVKDIRWLEEEFTEKVQKRGVYSFANGHCYEGSWHEGKRQGIGMYAFRNGETQSGHWQNGVIDTPSSQSATYPVSPVGVNHSRVLNAVQEARRAAKKAYDVAKVDERVNRAVAAAANRAANAARVASVKAVQNQMHHNVNSKSIPIPIV